MFSLSLGNSSSNNLNYTTGRKLDGKINVLKVRATNALILVFILLIVSAGSACAVLQPIDTSSPHDNTPAYPILVESDPARENDALVAWKALAQRYDLTESAQGNLQPVTATVRTLANGSNRSTMLPKVGTEPTQSEEETRESLRRFIVDWQDLIGAQPDELSLVERTDTPDGTKVARYEQRPFRYPLRGGYGSLIIRFRADRRVLDVVSNCLPDTERLQAALSNLNPRLTPEEVVAAVKNQPATPTDQDAATRNISLSASSVVNVRQLVVYITPRGAPPQELELHLAWEIDVSNGPMNTIYLDAVSGRVIATA
jgi:hypothetical protein